MRGLGHNALAECAPAHEIGESGSKS